MTLQIRIRTIRKRTIKGNYNSTREKKQGRTNCFSSWAYIFNVVSQNKNQPSEALSSFPWPSLSAMYSTRFLPLQRYNIFLVFRISPHWIPVPCPYKPPSMGVLSALVSRLSIIQYMHRWKENGDKLSTVTCRLHNYTFYIKTASRVARPAISNVLGQTIL